MKPRSHRSREVRRGRRRWYLLIHQLPPKPLYLRAKIRQRLIGVGAIALKKSVYVLPQRDQCLEDFERIAEDEGRNRSELFREMLRVYRAHRETGVFESLQRYGAIWPEPYSTTTTRCDDGSP